MDKHLENNIIRAHELVKEAVDSIGTWSDADLKATLCEAMGILFAIQPEDE